MNPYHYHVCWQYYLELDQPHCLKLERTLVTPHRNSLWPINGGLSSQHIYLNSLRSTRSMPQDQTDRASERKNDIPNNMRRRNEDDIPDNFREEDRDLSDAPSEHSDHESESEIELCSDAEMEQEPDDAEMEQESDDAEMEQ
ncbi:hypothetical protein JTB14_026921 [Gonioctena quinquepunctata]|nr:hypothetical protein JTB14_026921 [Gonioctena quinquepunctata]